MKEYLITSGFLDRPRKLILTEDHLEWENGNLKGKEFTRLNKSDIVDFKHGRDWIVWYEFTVGQKFAITFKDNRNKELKIQFNSHFGLHKENIQKYSDIVDDIWRLYHSNIVDVYLDNFYHKGEIEIQGIKLQNEGVVLRGQQEIIRWDKIGMKDYYRYFALYNKDNPTIHSNVSYNEYGTEALWSVMRTILKEEMNTSQ